MSTLSQQDVVTPPQSDSIRLIPLTQGKVAIIDASDYESISKFKWFARYSPSGDTWYAVRSVNSSGIYMHRQIMQSPKGILVDHRDGDGLNNQRSNLRLATHRQNSLNRSAQSNSQSRIKGVRFHKSSNKWEARIVVNKSYIYLGLHSTAEQASIAYNAAAILYFGEFARLNISQNNS